MVPTPCSINKPALLVLSSAEKRCLLSIARSAIADQADPDPDITDSLKTELASFVTITKADALRGCIGSLEPRKPLYLDVHDNAISAAYRDPRFPPLDHHEVELITIDISVLSPHHEIYFNGIGQLEEQLIAGEDGLILEQGLKRATFLPSVWESLGSPESFVGQLLLKGNIRPDDTLRAWRYSTESFSEEEFAA